MLALCSMLSGTYYAHNYASIIGGSLPTDLKLFQLIAVCKGYVHAKFQFDIYLVHMSDYIIMSCHICAIGKAIYNIIRGFRRAGHILAILYCIGFSIISKINVTCNCERANFFQFEKP